MSITLPLDEVTVHEKLEVMEALWENPSQRPETLDSPDWHPAVLAKRERRIASGKGRCADWEEAKAGIVKRVS